MKAHINAKIDPHLVAKRLGRMDDLVGPLRGISVPAIICSNTLTTVTFLDYSP